MRRSLRNRFLREPRFPNLEHFLIVGAVDFDDDVLAVGLLVKFNLEVEFGIGHETCLIDRIDLRGRDRCGSECTENADGSQCADAVLNMNFCMVMWCSCGGENWRVRVRLQINGQMADGKGEDSFRPLRSSLGSTCDGFATRLRQSDVSCMTFW